MVQRSTPLFNIRLQGESYTAEGDSAVDLTHIEWKGSDESQKKILEAVEMYWKGTTVVAVILDLFTCIMQLQVCSG